MWILHLLAGIGLILITLFIPLKIYFESNQLRQKDYMTASAVAEALLLGIVLFTGFIQLGSRNDVPELILLKLALVILGGLIALLASFMALKWNRLTFFLIGQELALVCFTASIILAVMA